MVLLSIAFFQAKKHFFTPSPATPLPEAATLPPLKLGKKNGYLASLVGKSSPQKT